MADMVVKMDLAHRVEQTTVDGAVVLKFHGRVNGKEARIEIGLNSWGLQYAVSAMRAGCATKAREWQCVKEVLGDG